MATAVRLFGVGLGVGFECCADEDQRGANQAHPAKGHQFVEKKPNSRGGILA